MGNRPEDGHDSASLVVVAAAAALYWLDLSAPRGVWALVLLYGLALWLGRFVYIGSRHIMPPTGMASSDHQPRTTTARAALTSRTIGEPTNAPMTNAFSKYGASPVCSSTVRSERSV